MCDSYSEDVMYITKIIDGLEHALDAETINKLYSDYITQIKDYNSYIDELLAHRKKAHITIKHQCRYQFLSITI